MKEQVLILQCCPVSVPQMLGGGLTPVGLTTTAVSSSQEPESVIKSVRIMTRSRNFRREI